MWLLLSLLMCGFLASCQSDMTALQCGPEFRNRCLCGKTENADGARFIVNCTKTGFTNTNVLEHLPRKTDMLIFTGNNITVLPWNVFGNQDNIPNLRLIDMSYNGIKEIHGKSYHHVATVERLILDHNQLSLSLDGVEDHRHPRMFSNFINLRALHLTNAFKDNSPSNLAHDLHDIFINSNLSHLNKLHLEQNELTGFVDQMVFCDLPELMDLHLGDNYLRNLHFNLTCLRHLRFLDLQRNRITRLSAADLAILDSFPARGQQLTVDLSGNPLCDCMALHAWLKTTNVTVRNKENLKCDPSMNMHGEGNSKDDFHRIVSCTSLLSAGQRPVPVPSGMTSGAAVAIAVLSVAVVGLLGILAYMKRASLHYRLSPLLDTVSRKVHYTTIGKLEEQEMDL